MQGRQESETRDQIAASDFLKKWTWLYGVRGGCFCQTWAKQLLNAFQTGAQTHKRHCTTALIWQPRSRTRLRPQQINRVLFGKCKRLKLVQRIFSPGLPALGAVGQWGAVEGGTHQAVWTRVWFFSHSRTCKYMTMIWNQKEAVTDRRVD